MLPLCKIHIDRHTHTLSYTFNQTYNRETSCPGIYSILAKMEQKITSSSSKHTKREQLGKGNILLKQTKNPNERYDGKRTLVIHSWLKNKKKNKKLLYV